MTTVSGLVSFNQISTYLRLPGFYMEMDNSMAVQGLALDRPRILMLGQKATSGTASPATVVRVSSVDEGTSLFGKGSMLERMVKKVKAAHEYGDLWCLPLADTTVGQAATASITLTGTAVRAGTLNVYIGGQRVRVAAAKAATAASVAALLAAAINAAPDLGTLATVLEGVVTLTSTFKGEVGNGRDVRVNYYTDERLPEGLKAVCTLFKDGTGNPDLSTALAALGDTQYHYVITPYTDSANMDALEAVLRERWGAEKQVEGIIFSAATGALSRLTTLGNGLNCEFLSILGLRGTPTPAYELAASYGAVAAKHLDEDPARPLQTLILPDVMAPIQQDQLPGPERNTLLWEGIATATADADGKVRIEREVSTYKLNAWGLPDPSYLDINTPATCSVLRRTWRSRMAQRYPRHMLAKDGSPAALSGKAVATPSTLRAEMIALARLWEESAWVEDVDTFKKKLEVMRNTNNPNRVDCILPPDLVNQLRQVAALLQFRV
ncbi:MAG: phage tail sheath subtilisin-like domain-containing protein [Desulfovibrionaceae bacterium]